MKDSNLRIKSFAVINLRGLEGFKKIFLHFTQLVNGGLDSVKIPCNHVGLKTQRKSHMACKLASM